MTTVDNGLVRKSMCYLKLPIQSVASYMNITLVTLCDWEKSDVYTERAKELWKNIQVRNALSSSSSAKNYWCNQVRTYQSWIKVLSLLVLETKTKKIKQSGLKRFRMTNRNQAFTSTLLSLSSISSHRFKHEEKRTTIKPHRHNMSWVNAKVEVHARRSGWVIGKWLVCQSKKARERENFYKFDVT